MNGGSCGCTSEISLDEPQDGAPFPYLADPYEASHEMALRLKWIADAQVKPACHVTTDSTLLHKLPIHHWAYHPPLIAHLQQEHKNRCVIIHISHV